MKITLILLLTTAFSAFSMDVHSQNAKVSLDTNIMKVAQLISAIESQTNYLFVYSKKNVDLSRKVKINAKNKAVSEILDEVFSGTGITYVMEGKNIVLTKENNIAREEVKQQNTITVKGAITDMQGEAIIGANIIQQGTTNGTITDIDGNFTLEVPADAQLVISYIGYKKVIIPVNGKTNFTIKMEDDALKLETVVVTAMGIKKKEASLTYSTQQLNGDELNKVKDANMINSLAGKSAGVQITKSSSGLGGSAKVSIRGARSAFASGNNQPLYVIDGVPMLNITTESTATVMGGENDGVNHDSGDGVSNLNPDDIESMSILKGASAAALYGSQAANGVILITTKGGKEGKAIVNFNAYVGVNGWSRTPEMRSGESYIQTLRDASVGAGDGRWNSVADDKNLFTTDAEWNAHQNGQYIDWVDALLKTSVTQNYSVSVAGGTEKTKAYFSLNFSNEDGQFAQDSYKLYSSKIRVDHKIKKWMKVGIDAQLSYVHQNKADSDLQTLMASNPLGSLYNEDGSINPQPVADPSSTVYNYLLNEDKSLYRNQAQNLKVYFNPYLEITPLKGLTFITRAGASLGYSRSNTFTGEGSVQWYKANQTADGIKAQVKDNRSYNYKWENILTYNFQIKKVHDITLTAVTSWNHNRSDVTTLYQKGVSDNKFLWHNILDGNSATSGSTSYSMSKGMGYVGRLNYSYMGRYLFAASVRHDGSSRLAEGNKWDTFPAFSLGWRISDEKFMESTTNWLSNLKIRFGYGVTGSTAGIDPYSSAASLDATAVNMILGGVLTPIYKFSQNIPNYLLTWEKSYNTNIGIDAAFLNNRIDVSMEYYNTKTKDVIWNKALPVINGAFSPDGGPKANYTTNLNMCETSNKGFELALNTRNIITKNFTWSSSVTFNHNKEKITKLSGGDSDVLNNGDTGYALALGEAINSYYHYKLDGVWQKGEETDAAVFGAAPGDLKINIPNLVKESDGRFYKIDEETGSAAVDENGNVIYYTSDNKYTPSDADYQILGHNSPDWSLGFQNNFTWKDFDLSVFVYARYGQMFAYDMLTSYDPKGIRNFPTYFNYWTENNPSNDFPAANANKGLEQYTGYYALRYVDGSFIKIKNITLGYSLPKSILKSAGIEKCRFYATITNPFVFAKSHLLKDYDPEMNGSLKYPLTKQFVFGVNVTF